MAGLVNALRDPEQERINAQIAYANALRDSGAEGSTGAAASGYQGGPVYMVGNALQGAIKNIGGIAGGIIGDRKKTELEALRHKEMADWVGGMPTATTTAPAFSDQQVHDIPSPMLTKSLPRLGTREVPKTWQQQATDMQNWGKRGLTMGSPEAQQLGIEAVQSSIATPEKMQALEAQNELKKAYLGTQFGYKTDLEHVKGGIRRDLQDQQGDIRSGQIDQQGKYAWGRTVANNDTKTGLTLAGFDNTAKRDATKAENAVVLKQTIPGKAAGGGKVSPKLTDIQRNNNMTIDQLSQLGTTLETNPDAFGWQNGILGALPKWGDKLVDWHDPEGVPSRTMYQRVANMELKDRAGASVTDQEWTRFKKELGDTTTQPAVMAAKIKSFLDYAKQKGYYIANDIASQGGTPVEAVSQRTPATVRTAPPKPAGMSDASYAEFKTSKGYQ